MAARALEVDGKKGWEYQPMVLPAKTLAESGERRDWHPSELTLPEFIVMNILCAHGSIDIADPEFVEVLAKNGVTVADLCKSLSDKQLAAVKEQRLELLTDGCDCLIMPDGRYIANENKTGRLIRYALKEREAILKQKAAQKTKTL
jgi:hypothetical protein